MRHYLKTCVVYVIMFIIISGGNPLLVPVDDDDLQAEEDDEEEVDKVQNIIVKQNDYFHLVYFRQNLYISCQKTSCTHCTSLCKR